MPEEDQNDETQTPPTTLPKAVKPPTSHDVVSRAEVRAMQDRITKVETDNTSLLNENKELKKIVEGLSKIPSKKAGKSLLEELDEFVFGDPSNPPTPPEKT